MATPERAPAHLPGFGRVRELQDILDRSRVDEITGCWHWARAFTSPGGSVTPVVMFAADGAANANNMSAARAAWLLSGRKIGPQQVVWRKCGSPLCVNPEHCAAGTKREMFGAISASGRNKGKPERRAVCERNRAAQLTPREVVQRAEAMFDAGMLQKDVRAELGITQATARRIRLRQHPHSTGRQHVLPGASVFSLGAAA